MRASATPGHRPLCGSRLVVDLSVRDKGRVLNLCGVYVIRNKVSGKTYVGSTSSTRNRWKSHRWSLNKGVHHSLPLQKDWTAFGEGAFGFEVLEEVPADLLIEREQYWIDALGAYMGLGGYNMLPQAGSVRGWRHSEEWKAAKSAAYKGWKVSKEWARNISIGQRAAFAERKALGLPARDRSPEGQAAHSAAVRESNRRRTKDPVFKICAGCGGAFRPKRPGRKYCSQACGSKAKVGTRNKRPEGVVFIKACEGCGQSFQAPGPASKFCSEECAFPLKTCPGCGNEFRATRPKGKFCSRACGLPARRYCNAA